MLTRDLIVQWFMEIEERGWPKPQGTGPWIDFMDQGLRRHPLDYQFAIVGFALGNTYDDAHQAAWKVLLEHVNKRARLDPEIANPGSRPPRPMSVLPGYSGGTAKGGFRRRR